MIKFSKF